MMLVKTATKYSIDYVIVICIHIHNIKEENLLIIILI